MAYTTIDNPELYFQTVLWTGNGSSSRSITLDGSEDMQPDWTWIKARAGSEGTQQHYLYDSVRGATKYLQSSTTNAEGTKSNGLSAFASDGFTIGDDNANNGSSTTYVAWNWKAGNSSGSSNSDGSISSTVSVNTTAGFSIVSYTGTGSATTVGHGLGVAPKLIIVKRRDSSANWFVGSDSLGWTKYLYLDLTEAAETNAGAWNNTSPTSSVFSIGTFGNVNASSGTYIAYCFSEKKGYSKIGTYTGNGNADGTFVYTGFAPAFVLSKCTSHTGENWNINDNKRPGSNVIQNALLPDSNAAEVTASFQALDILSNGFKWRGTNDRVNASGKSYLYMAFAESPFVNANRIPNNAR